MGTGKTSTCVEELIERRLKNVRVNTKDPDWIPNIDCSVLIAKPYINAGGQVS